jgi:uncharacterized protein YmfQ (DUF2313 family)
MVDGLMPTGVIWGAGDVATSTEFQDTSDSTEEWIDTDDGTEIYLDTFDAGWSGSKLDLLLSCIAAELARIEVEAWAVLNQTDPGVAVGTNLSGWETVLGLAGIGTESARQVDAHLKLFSPLITLTTGQIVSMAAAAGFTVTVNEDQFEDDHECGVAICGAARCDAGAVGKCTVIVTVTAGTGSYFAVEETVALIAPAHAVIIWVDAR